MQKNIKEKGSRHVTLCVYACRTILNYRRKVCVFSSSLTFSLSLSCQSFEETEETQTKNETVLLADREKNIKRFFNNYSTNQHLIKFNLAENFAFCSRSHDLSLYFLLHFSFSSFYEQTTIDKISSKLLKQMRNFN